MSRLKKCLKYDTIDTVPFEKEHLLIRIRQQNMVKLLKFLSGKKSIILGIITTTAAYLADIGKIDTKTCAFICAIGLLIFGTASVATGKLVYKK